MRFVFDVGEYLEAFFSKNVLENGFFPGRFERVDKILRDVVRV
jgi:hypothetical protein